MKDETIEVGWWGAINNNGDGEDDRNQFVRALPLHLMRVLDPPIRRPNQKNEIVHENIARSTTDPEIDSVTWIKFSNNMAPLA